MQIINQYINLAVAYRYGFGGHEKDDEIKGSGNSYTTEFRQWDPRLGRWLSPDPVIKHHESPYAWNTNNPILYIDEFGADSTQRANAVKKAEEFVDKSTGTSSSYGGKGTKSGESVDCSGLASVCAVAGGESNPVNGTNRKKAEEKFGEGKTNGVRQIVAGSQEVSMNDVQVGNFVTFGENSHIGIISGDIKKDKNGNVISFTVIGSQSSTGPAKITVRTDGSAKWVDGNNGYWSPKLGKAYKWDTKPDKPKLQKKNATQVATETSVQSTHSNAQKAQLKESQSSDSWFDWDFDFDWDWDVDIPDLSDPNVWRKGLGG